MFRTAELGRKVSKDQFQELAPPLRSELLEIQQKLRHMGFPVIVVFAGVDGAGKGESVNLISEWMDPRWIVTRAYGPPSDEERERPEFWRYWRDLPQRGTTGLFLSSWYSRPVLESVYGELAPGALDRMLDRICVFEKELADDGALVIKFWMHLSKSAQKRRFEQLEKDPHERWRVTKNDWENWRNYDKFILAAEHTIMRTSHAHAPWTIVEGKDERYRSLTVLTALRDAMKRHIAQRKALKPSAKTKPKANGEAAPDDGPVSVSLPPMPSVLGSLKIDANLEKNNYQEAIQQQRARLNKLYRKARDKGVSTVLVFEGWDAAGKGGAIRRLTTAMDARGYIVMPVAAPTDEERRYHYLWRFWRHLTRAGRVIIFDRSWYGRVLVERVEGFAQPVEWRRAYAEINDFERQLVEHGTVLAKFWLHITKDEQLDRFQAREATPYKRWKLTEEDWRNREKWEQYELAVNDMVQQTSTYIAPWTLVEANCKRYSRIKVFETVCNSLEAALKNR